MVKKFLILLVLRLSIVCIIIGLIYCSTLEFEQKTNYINLTKINLH